MKNFKLIPILFILLSLFAFSSCDNTPQNSDSKQDVFKDAPTINTDSDSLIIDPNFSGEAQETDEAEYILTLIQVLPHEKNESTNLKISSQKNIIIYTANGFNPNNFQITIWGIEEYNSSNNLCKGTLIVRNQDNKTFKIEFDINFSSKEGYVFLNSKNISAAVISLI